MDNFDLRKFLAEGKLHEELNGQEVTFLAQYIADAFTEEDAEGDRFSTYMTYTVGDIDGNSFELDTKATEKTPEDDAKYGTGRGWGGSFRIKPIEGGYEVRNSEKGGLVATISDQGELTMLDAEQSKAEMGGDTDYMERRRETSDYMEEGETLNEGLFDTVKDKLVAAKDKIMSKVSPEAIAMFKSKVEQALGKSVSELGVEDLTLANAKKVGALVKDEVLAEEALNEGVKETIGNILGILGLGTSIVGLGLGAGPMIAVAGLVMLAISWMTSLEESVNEAEEVTEYSSKMKKSELKEMIRAAFLNEAEGDEEEDVEAEIEADVDVDVDADMDMDMDAGEDGINVKQDADAELGGTVGDVQDNLEAALEAARKLGDEKLEDQIGNTLTFFTRTHVVK